VEDNRNSKVLQEQRIRGGFQKQHEIVLKRGYGEAEIDIGKIIDYAGLGIHSIPKASEKKRFLGQWL
jgi:hypothetical protein